MVVRRRYWIGLRLVLVLILLGYGLFVISKSRTFQFFGVLINRVNTSEKVVALTFDDAPTVSSDKVLEILKQKQIKATFYEIGKNIEENPEAAKHIVEAGMEVGNHSYTHQRMIFKSQAFIDEEIQKTNQLIRNTGYAGEITFRPPYDKKLFGLPWYLSQHHIKTITMDVEPDTYTMNMKEGDYKTDYLIDYTLKNTRKGSIILMHPFCDSCESDRKALGRIIDGLTALGYRFVTVSELIDGSKM